MNRTLIFSFLLFLGITNGFSQSAVFLFEKTTHDFGNVKEEGPITYEFKFTNKGTVPLVISSVKASCGCTTPGWTKEPIPPGKTGVITAQYNTINRPGFFNKNLTVTANTKPEITLLYITGTVLPKIKTPQELYPTKIGKIRMFSDHISMDRITTKEPVSKEIIIYNEGPDSVTFAAPNLPKHMSVSFSSITIPPNDKITVKIGYNAKMKNDFGPVNDDIELITNEATANKKVLHVFADINEYYAPLTAEELVTAPKLSFSKSIYDFGTIKVNGVYEGEIEIANTGKKDLIIKKVRCGAPYITVKIDKTTIKAGRTGKLKISYKADGKMGADTQIIYVHSNDANSMSSPTQNITIKANVIQ